jgi:DNA-binding NtrC family response regulator
MQHANISVIEPQSAVCCQAAGSGANAHVTARSPAMREILDLVRKVAAADVPVLIQGEMGAGKQTIAREIHRQSPRAAGPFVHVVCGSLREADLEERLFGPSWNGSRRGTGGPASLLEASQDGTLFLDGVAQLPLWAQVRLLDALQSGEEEGGPSPLVRSRAPTGGWSRAVPANGTQRVPGALFSGQPRLIASSTCDLETAMVENRLYSGLYYYLNAAGLEVPPLRHRQEDILALAEHFLAAAVSTFSPPRNKLPWRFSEEARQALLRYDWPGNVPQLAAVVAHAAILSEGSKIGEADIARLLGRVRQHPDAETISVPLAGGLKEMEATLINEVLRRCRGNKAAAARALKLHRRTLYRLLEE